MRMRMRMLMTMRRIAVIVMSSGSSRVLGRPCNVLGGTSRVLGGSSRVLGGSRRVLVGGSRMVLFVNAELRRRHGRRGGPFGADIVSGHREAAQRARQLGKRQPGVEEGASTMSRDAREAVEIQHARHYNVPSP